MYLAIDTSNSKIVGNPRREIAAALSLPIENTCPSSCPFRARGEDGKSPACYAENGRQALHVARLEKLSEGLSSLAVAKAAVGEIIGAAKDGQARNRPLRLFVSGDVRGPRAARLYGQAAEEWHENGGDAVWGYTHAWRRIPRSTWGKRASVLASVETHGAALRALREGYAPARVFPSLPEDGRAFKEGSVTYVPCPEQSRGVPCVECRLCFDADALAERRHAIAFGTHGARKNEAVRRLTVLQ